MASYSVSLVPEDMRLEDALVQLADTLDFLERLVADMFGAVNARLVVGKKRVQELSNRVSRMQKKVDTLATTKKATVVFSCTKYPAQDIHQPYKSCFPMKPKQQPEKSVNHLRNNISQVMVSDNISNKIQFFHVKITESKTTPRERHLRGVNSVCDLLIFNSPKSPYYHQLNPFHQQKRDVKEQEKKQLDAPPQSISCRQSLSRREDKNYFYSPDIGDVPTIDVPVDLPDLPGIADGLRYDVDTGPGIAPSVITSPVLPDLPTIEETEKASFPPPMVPQVIPMPEISEVKQVDPKPPPRPPQPPPPPPPFPDPSPPVPEEAVAPLKPPPRKQPPPSGGELRDSLMAAIRAAGGAQKAKLKSANATEPSPAPAGTGATMSLMDDLHLKLSLRRKGISGSKAENSANPFTSAMSKISTMIPPPPKTDTQESATTDDNDEEWDEDD